MPRQPIAIDYRNLFEFPLDDWVVVWCVFCGVKRRNRHCTDFSKHLLACMCCHCFCTLCQWATIVYVRGRMDLSRGISGHRVCDLGRVSIHPRRPPFPTRSDPELPGLSAPQLRLISTIRRHPNRSPFALSRQKTRFCVRNFEPGRQISRRRATLDSRRVLHLRDSPAHIRSRPRAFEP
jgi:hypothetical protein